MRTYYHDHPRDFANECDIASATTPAGREQCADMERLSVADLRQHLSWLRGEADGWGSGNAGSAYCALSVLHGRYDVERDNRNGPCPTCGAETH
jgi:hypothetical protein